MTLHERISKKLAEDLSEERPISRQVQEYITDHYGYSVDDLPRFCTEKVAELEDYELDLVFSPLFTPTLEDRAEYMPILAEGHLPKADIARITKELVERSIYGHFITPDRQNIPMVLKDVSIERFVDRLYLERPIDESVYQAIEKTVPANDRPMTQVLARKPGWQDSWRKEMLKAFLETFEKRKNFNIGKVTYLTDFLRTYRPGCIQDLERQLESLIESCRKDLENVAGRSFHDAHLKEVYAESEKPSMSVSEEEKTVTANYKQMIANADELLKDYWAMKELLPDAVERMSALTPVK